MHEKRYQVFISSTFEDLKAERRAVQDVVISTGDFPVQMESFPAADEDQFAFIKSLIDKCDYYVLIIAGRYGTCADDGISYTHKEFRYAVEQGVPVLVMLHGDRGKITTDKSEATDEGRKRLGEFIEETSNGRLRKTWTTLDELKLRVREALDHAKATKPRVGWVRGDATASIEALEELNEVRKENAKFRDALGQLEIEIPLPQLPAVQSTLVIDLLPHQKRGGIGRRGSSGCVRTTWITMFPLFHSNLKWQTSDYGGDSSYWIEENESCVSIGSAIAQEVSDEDTTDAFKISKGTLHKLIAYYVEAGLMLPQGQENPFTSLAEKIARRHRFAETEQPDFVLQSGLVEVSVNYGTQNNDEIPF
ncbi:DUF4062 domain-containing protein [Brucella pseudogrignonensis]|uniref:DUF4062 domain-containing protein n=1 Tax=Brucella pseudogrignonensis TaxID=419475 RepID=UPI001E58692E|nr:DUF4062 domain-containing protein [Brucella pseudogrignonensis]MCD4512196.1 DUF4062 domain-containing protein [Brucella pseudogrignonensis]